MWESLVVIVAVIFTEVVDDPVLEDTEEEPATTVPPLPERWVRWNAAAVSAASAASEALQVAEVKGKARSRLRMS